MNKVTNKNGKVTGETKLLPSEGQGGNREVISDVFSMRLQYPENALDVYNALNGSCYDDPSLVQITTMQNGISLTVRNDASFFIGGCINFYEHQSTYNPNMPLRFTIYYLDHLKKWISDNEEDLYGKKRIMLPTPHFVVFYNGLESRPDFEVMRLSASFQPTGENGDDSIEVKCKVYNVNYGRNSWLAKNSKVICGYGTFVEKVRRYRDAEELAEAIDHAINDCIDEGILKEFFIARRNEVRKAMQLDFTWERREKLIRKEEFAEGKAEGKADSVIEILEDLGEVPQELRDEINAEKNLEELSRMLKLAAKAESMEDFVAKWKPPVTAGR